MKDLNDKRIENAKKVAKADLVERVKSHDPKRYDQVLIESEERKNYYFVKYRSTAFSRSVIRLDFPLQKEFVADFESHFSSNGDVRPIDDSKLIKKVIASGYEAVEASKYIGKKLVFGELKIATENDRVKLLQPTYYIPSEVKRETCGTCRGDKYNTCTEPECRGQHIYDCNECHARGEVDCKDCGARGEYRCPSCAGKGEIKCYQCYGSGFEKHQRQPVTCKVCHGSRRLTCKNHSGLLGMAVGKQTCGGSGIIRCKKCSATGKVTCKKCQGDGRIECKVCHDDHIDNRYGKVDCETCETAGELASITYIETEIKNDDFDLLCTDGKPIDSPDFSLDTIKNHVNSKSSVQLTFKDLNGNKVENYDDYSSFGSKNALAKAGISKESYPKLLSEEMYVEAVPCATFHYNHILSSTPHDVSVLAIDESKEVLYHSDPTSVSSEPDSIWNKIQDQFKKAFSTKSYKDKIDRKHEFLLMVHMAKADGIIEDEEKKFLSANISGLDGFTNKEKAELFGLMSTDELPPITAKNAYFSSRAKADEVTNKLVELIAKADGEYEKPEKDKLEEINQAIEAGYKLKPYGIGTFFKTWQISVPLMVLLILSMAGAVFGVLIYPNMKSPTTVDQSPSITIKQDKTANESNGEPSFSEATQDEALVGQVDSSTAEGVPSIDSLASMGVADGNVELFKIEDPDGYCNMRETPGGNIIRIVYDSETFEVVDSDGKWKNVKFSDGTTGYIHESRVAAVGPDLSIEIFDGEFPQSSTRPLSIEELASYSMDDLKIMRNEIFARHGYIFKTGGEMDAYFQRQLWYTPKVADATSLLSEIEEKNLQLIQFEEGSR